MAEALSDEERRRILHLHGLGESRNAIARAVDRSPGVVSKIVKAAGLAFERGAEVAAATEAKRMDNKAKRARLQELLLDDALKLREQLWEPAWLYNFNKDGAFSQERIEQPDFAGQNAIMRTVGVAIDKAARLSEADAGSNADHARSVISQLGQQIRDLVGEYPDDTSTEPEADDG